jgi:predicted Zn-dependent peptidase
MSRESLAVRAEQAAAQILAFGRLIPDAQFAAEVEAVGEADVARLAARLLAPGKAASAALGPVPALDAPARFEAALFG